ncbi:alcohol dehydrogenase [Monosporozyma unispora]|nr:alcohol dehydrogenase [Kazachstania unispora]
MSYPEKFQGIAVLDHKDYKHPKKVSFDPKPFHPSDVDIRILNCSVCGSDCHSAQGNWGMKPKPHVVGHEVIGLVTKLGPNCTSGLKLGDRVGVGAQVFSCLECNRCKSNNEPYCNKFVTTYGQAYEDGYVSQGGYASHIRVHEHFVVPIPENIPSELAAPWMCGGLTVYSPLIRNGCGPNKKVAILGLGGLGHMALQIAKGLVAEVYAISRTSAKKEDAQKLGADHFIATKEEPNWTEKYYDTFDLILICAGSLTDVDFTTLPNVMKVGGAIRSVSIPDESLMLTLQPFGLVGVSIGNSCLGSMEELKQLIKLVSEKDLKPWIETIPISEKGVQEAFEKMERGDVRYRITFVDFDKEFGN